LLKAARITAKEICCDAIEKRAARGLAVSAAHPRVRLMGVHVTGVYLTGVHHIGMYLMGAYLTGVGELCS
jgi:hypothetical protein